LGPWISVILGSVLVLVQGWSCFSPTFNAVDFVSFYIELPIMLIMFVAWKLIKRTRFVRLDEMDLVTDVYTTDDEEPDKPGLKGRLQRWFAWVL
jgi:AAT family amino acid transporter